MKFAIEDWPPVRIAYARRTGAYGPQNKETMERLKLWAREKGLLEQDAVLLGIAQDDPRTVPAYLCRYDACIVTEREVGPEEPVREGSFEGGRYAVFLVPHTAEGLRFAWTDAFPVLQKAGHRPSDKPAVERYAEAQLRKGFCELCVPLREAP